MMTKILASFTANHSRQLTQTSAAGWRCNQTVRPSIPLGYLASGIRLISSSSSSMSITIDYL